MKQIVVASIKGGVGKTTVAASLARSLKKLGFTVGYLDVDITAPTGSEAFGLTEPPERQLDAVREAIVPTEVDGIQFITLASDFGRSPAVLWDEARKIDAARQLLRGVVAWPNVDWLVLDTPPSSSGEMQALYDYITDLHGVILVFQPTDMAAADLLRTVDFLRFKRVPILGLVSNMSYCISPGGEKFWPFLSPKVDLGEICRQFGILLLGEIPLTPDKNLVEAAFLNIAARIDGVKPVVIDESKAKKLVRSAKRKLLKAAVRRL